MNIVILIVLAIIAIIVWSKMRKKQEAPGVLQKLDEFGKRVDVNERADVNSGVHDSNDTLTKRTAFLEDIPSDAEIERSGISAEDRSCLNYINKLSTQGNHIDAVRWTNRALSLNPPFDLEIALHRNRIVALGELFGIGRSGARRDLDYCIATERVVRDYEAIIGLYASNEEEIKRRNDADFFDESFEVALRNLMPIGLSYAAYQNNDGSYGTYKPRLPHVWRIDFVREPKNALSVNGKIYPQHRLPK